jgi:hypothetical protein
MVNIDLSGNFLGHSAWPANEGNRLENTYGMASHWCLAGPSTAYNTGWCPRDGADTALPPRVGLPQLVLLDLSNNGFQGTRAGWVSVPGACRLFVHRAPLLSMSPSRLPSCLTCLHRCYIPP